MIFVELNMKGSQHARFNRDFINYFLARDGTTPKRVSLVCGSTHFKEISFIGLPKLLNKLPFPAIILKSGHLWRSILKVIAEISQSIIFILIAKILNREIIFLSSYPPVKLVIILVCFFIKKDVAIIHHGELEGLRTPRRYTSFVKAYFDVTYRKFVKDIFLSESIYKDVRQLIGRELPSAEVIFHPIGSCELPAVSNLRPHFTIAYAGSLTRFQHANLERLIRLLLISISGDAALIHLVIVAPGADLLDVAEFPKRHIVDTSKGLLSQREFDAILENVDVFFLPYDKGDYDLTASGVLMDCIRRGKPVCCVESGFFLDAQGVYPELVDISVDLEHLAKSLSRRALEGRIVKAT